MRRLAARDKEKEEWKRCRKGENAITKNVMDENELVKCICVKVLFA